MNENTKNSLINAFLKLRKNTPLENLKLKTLIKEAKIGKATFYLHYKDIYDFSYKLQISTIKKIIDTINISKPLENTYKDIITNLYKKMIEKKETLKILFNGSQISNLALILESEAKQRLFNTFPEYKASLEINTLLSYQIYGSCYTYLENYKKLDDNILFEQILKLSITLIESFKEENKQKNSLQ